MLLTSGKKKRDSAGARVKTKRLASLSKCAMGHEVPQLRAKIKEVVVMLFRFAVGYVERSFKLGLPIGFCETRHVIPRMQLTLKNCEVNKRMLRPTKKCLDRGLRVPLGFPTQVIRRKIPGCNRRSVGQGLFRNVSLVLPLFRLVR